MNPQESKRGGPAFDTFGWQGIRLTVPVGWDMIVTDGDHTRGYLRMADSEQVRLELRWEPGNPAVDASVVVANYLRDAKKAAQKRGLAFKVTRHIKLAALKDKELECYRWTSDRQAFGMASRCLQCGRLLHVHVLGRVEEQLKGVAGTVFASMRDHPEDGELLWRFFDVEFGSPADMQLRKRDLKTGCIRMLFSGRREELEFIRISLADLVLADKGLAQWFAGAYGSLTRRFSCTSERGRIRNHDALRLVGAARFPWRLLHVFGRPRVLRIACWHCDNSNRLLVCRHVGPDGRQDRFDSAVAGFRCCG